MLLLLLALFSAPAFAADCEAVDLRPQLGAPRDQADTGWCFAHTAADLMSVKLGKRVSAFDFAVQFIANDLEEWRRSPGIVGYLAQHPGFYGWIKKIRRDEPENFLPSHIFSLKGIFNQGGSEDAALLLSNLRGACLDAHFEDGEAGFEKSIVELRRMLSVSRKRGDPVEHALALALEWVDARCGRRLRYTRPALPESHYIAKSLDELLEKKRDPAFALREKQAGLVREIDINLSAGRPVAIGYNAFDVMKLSRGEDPNSGDHSSLLVARRKIQGECRYFLRNSWGENCNIYSAKFKTRCEQKSGGVWVSSAELTTLYSVITLP